MLTLYHAIPSRSSIARWMLEEVGEPYDVQPLSLQAGENRKPAYLAINPMGKVPALDHDGVVITESGGDLHLSRRRVSRRRGSTCRSATSGAAPILNGCSSARAASSRPSPIAPFRARRKRGAGRWVTATTTRSSMCWRKASRGGPYLLGEQFTAADVVIGSGLRWGMMFKLIPERPEFMAYVGRLNERPALKRAQEKDAAASPPAKN